MQRCKCAAATHAAADVQQVSCHALAAAVQWLQEHGFEPQQSCPLCSDKHGQRLPPTLMLCLLPLMWDICSQVRFFGKFFGTHADYYVFETTLKSPPEEPEQQPGEQAAAPKQPCAPPACCPYGFQAYIAHSSHTGSLAA